MCIQNRTIALAYRVSMTLLVLIALYRVTVFVSGSLDAWILVYYTIQSALWGLLLLAATAVRTASDLRTRGARGWTALPPRLVGSITLAVTITMLVYHFVLVPRAVATPGDYRPFSTNDLLIHYVTPLAVILDWLLFVHKGRYRWVDPLVWLVLPLAYFAFAMARARLGGPLPGGGRYPYFFIDLDALGRARLSGNVAGLTLLFALLGGVYLLVDAGLARVGGGGVPER